MFGIPPSSRLRPSPLFETTRAAGVSAFTDDNPMWIPASCGHPRDEDWRVIRGPRAEDVIAMQALPRIHAEGPRSHRLGVMREGSPPTWLGLHRNPIFRDGESVDGQLRSLSFL